MLQMVSLVMPVKNAAPFLAETLASLYAQSYPHWELIAVNDGSTDTSLAILKQAALIEPRVKVFENYPQQGIIAALSMALKHSQGAFIGRLDADDLLPPNRLNLMVSALSRSKPKTVVTGQVEYFSQGKVSLGYQKYEAWLNRNLDSPNPWRQVYRECIVASPNWLMHRQDLLALGGFSSLNYPEDYDLVFRWYQAGYQLKFIKQLTLLWREHPKRTSRSSANYNQASFFKLKIKRFVVLEQPLNNLVLLGEGQKAQLAHKELTTLNQTFSCLGLKAKPATPNYPALAHFKTLGNLKKPKVLVAIYPPAQQRAALEQFLTKLNLHEGKDWWYL